MRNNNLTMSDLRLIAQPDYKIFVKRWGITRQLANYYKKHGIPSDVFNELNAKTGGKLNQFIVKQDVEVDLEVDLDKL